MKFLCVSCDEAMNMMDLAPPDRGSLSVVYRCPTCEHEIAMLTNPFETQMVNSLGVKIGSESQSGSSESKCPFTSIVQEVSDDPSEAISDLSWSPEASLRLDHMPEFARPLAKAGIERFAREQGFGRIDIDVLDRARDSLGM